jgi:hypothetical protein
MNETLSTPALRNTFKFPFNDKEWIVPFIIGTALLFAGMILPIIPVIFVYGYIVEVMRISVRGEELKLPAWKDWGKYFKDGLRAIGVGLVFLGSSMIVYLIGTFAYFASFIALIAVSPESSNSTAAGLASLMMMGSMGIMFLSMFIATILFLAGAIPLPAAMAHFISHDKMSAAFHIREWTRIIGKDKWGYFISWLLLLGLTGVVYFGFVLAYMTFILCFVGFALAIPASFYIMLVSAALFGQVYREAATPSDATIK